MSIINVEQLKFKYPGAEGNAVDGVSFGIEKGAYTAIVGLNGSGKSTLARLICGLEEPLEGSITVEDGNLIGVIFQSPKNQIVSSIVSRDTAFGPQNLGLNSSEVELRTIESLSVVDMLDRADSSTSALSLGQTQKIALSGITAMHPEILILDEAVSMLDPESREEILKFVKRWQTYGNTIIHITHDIEIVKQADNVIGMENGKMFYYGKANTFLEKEENVFRLTGVPLKEVPKNKLKETLETKEITLSFKNVNFCYEKNTTLKNITFDLYKGTLTALTGPSGSGKSTILKIITGVLNPTEGSVTIDGRVSGKSMILELGAGLLVPAEGSVSGNRAALAQQNAQAALFSQFAADDVAYGPKNLGKTGKELKETVQKAMDDAYLPFKTFGERYTFGLSGGEQRRLSIAGIIALNSEVIFFDEPTAGLDSVSRNKIIDLLRKLADEGKTVLFSTHKMDEALAADREIRIVDGEIEKDTAKGSEVLCESDAGKNEKEDLKKENSFIPYPTAELMEGLRKTSASLSGTTRKKVSFIGKFPPVLRIIIFLAMFVCSLAVRPIWLCGLMLVISVLYGKLCGFNLKSVIVAILKILPFLMIFCIFQMIFHKSIPGEIEFTHWKWFLVTPSKLFYCLATILRTDASLVCICAFFISTPEYDLIDGLKIFLKPLAILRIPVRYFILIIEIIFRFIPLLVDEALLIIKTQSIRGGLGKVSGKMAKIKAVIPLIVPLIVQTIKKSESLADAITMRCFK